MLAHAGGWGYPSKGGLPLGTMSTAAQAGALPLAEGGPACRLLV